MLEVSISDSGIGIRGADLSRIFLPFERAESAGEGRGSTFRFVLPVAVPAEKAFSSTHSS
jgi:signal transduction histidine kinase